MTLLEETVVLKQATDELARELKDWEKETRIARAFGIREPEPPVGLLRENGLLAVCAWCHPGFNGPNVTHTVCDRHFAEVAGGVVIKGVE